MSVGKLTRYGLPYSNVVANGTATNMITPGRTLENLQIKLGGTLTKAMISLFRMKANGKTIIEATGSEMDKINAYRGTGTTNPKFLDAFFTDYSLNNELDRQVGAFDTTVGIANLTTEITISGATAPVLTPILVESAAQKSRQGESLPFAGLLTKLLRYPYNISTGGRLPVTVPFGPANGAIIKRLHIISNNGTVTGVTVKQDSLVVHESVKDENEFMQTRSGRVPQANMYTVDFVIDGDIKKALDTRDARSLEWLVDFSGADAGNILVEYVDTLGNL